MQSEWREYAHKQVKEALQTYGNHYSNAIQMPDPFEPKRKT